MNDQQIAELFWMIRVITGFIFIYYYSKLLGKGIKYLIER